MPGFLMTTIRVVPFSVPSPAAKSSPAATLASPPVAAARVAVIVTLTVAASGKAGDSKPAVLWVQSFESNSVVSIARGRSPRRR
jgi:hypothetical protein